MKYLGVLGGMGPAASAEFVSRLVAQTPATCDQEHIPTILWSDPRVPDRSTSLLNGDNAVWPFLHNGIQGLKQAGCDTIVIPCNTSHLWYEQMRDLGVPIIHIVDSVANSLRELGIVNTTIGIMGTQATIELGLYQQRLAIQGWRCIVPTTAEMRTFVTPAIDSIKAGRIADAHDPLLFVARSLASRGATAVVLGCTEIPLAVKETVDRGVPLVNSIDSLVRAAIKEFTNSLKDQAKP